MSRIISEFNIELSHQLLSFWPLMFCENSAHKQEASDAICTLLLQREAKKKIFRKFTLIHKIPLEATNTIV